MVEHVSRVSLALLDNGVLPDAVVRAAFRRMYAAGLLRYDQGNPEGYEVARQQFMARSSAHPLTPSPGFASLQHHGLPPAFYERVLGPHTKYSSAYFARPDTDLAAAEEDALRMTVTRSEITDGMRILDLGCGYGAFALWVAERFPRCTVVAMTHSAAQRRFISARCRARGISNLSVVSCELDEFQPEIRFDRVVSIEMMEHIRNHQRLMERIAGWLEPDGKLFVHAFCHRRISHELDGLQEVLPWIREQLLDGGTMPSADLLPRYDRHFHLEDDWTWSGQHYARTAQAWLTNMDARAGELRPMFTLSYGMKARMWWHRWRTFFLGVSELFGFDDGREWYVKHYRFARRSPALVPATPH